ncbi:unnamed protein product [Penicillium camemberti]|uniref:Str. FM013 n=1 Tax=Penicillium camemberti (strain FM 013) TaxID=1429867 RepID=A0A0G4PNI7_PENC3|nr:unnamed protein product [Penicillium camemberti]
MIMDGDLSCETTIKHAVVDLHVGLNPKSSAATSRDGLRDRSTVEMHSLRKLPEVTNSITLGRLHVHGIVYDPETEKPYRVSEGEQNH